MILIIVTSPILIQHNPYKNQASFAQVIDPIYSHASYFGKSIGLNKRTVPINRTVSSKWHQRVMHLPMCTSSKCKRHPDQNKGSKGNAMRFDNVFWTLWVFNSFEQFSISRFPQCILTWKCTTVKYSFTKHSIFGEGKLKWLGF